MFLRKQSPHPPSLFFLWNVFLTFIWKVPNIGSDIECLNLKGIWNYWIVVVSPSLTDCVHSKHETSWSFPLMIPLSASACLRCRTNLLCWNSSPFFCGLAKWDPKKLRNLPMLTSHYTLSSLLLIRISTPRRPLSLTSNLIMCRMKCSDWSQVIQCGREGPETLKTFQKPLSFWEKIFFKIAFKWESSNLISLEFYG